MHSAWIGEHHFNSLGVLSSPELVLSYIAARTKHIRLAPAVNVTPLPPSDPRCRAMGRRSIFSSTPAASISRSGRWLLTIRVRGQFKVDFRNNQPIFEEGMEILQKLWSAEGQRIDHHGKYYQFEDVRITPQPLQKPLPVYIGSFSKPSIELAARLGFGLIVAPFAAAMSYGGLKQVADLYKETCAKHGKTPKRLQCAFASTTSTYDTPAQEAAQRERQVRYYKECVIPAFPSDPKTAPPSYLYFVDMVKRLHQATPEGLTENSVLLGNSARMTEVLKKVEAAELRRGHPLAGDVGMKPHAQVKEEMARFMR